jgi:hypothetical protein
MRGTDKQIQKYLLPLSLMGESAMQIFNLTAGIFVLTHVTNLLMEFDIFVIKFIQMISEAGKFPCWIVSFHQPLMLAFIDSVRLVVFVLKSASGKLTHVML